WAVTASPTYRVLAMVIVTVGPSWFQAPWLWPLLMSSAQKPVKVLPCRTSRSQIGAGGSVMMWLPGSEVKPPGSVRHWQTGSFGEKPSRLGVSSMKALRELARRLSRIITPALAQKSVGPTLTARTSIAPSPVRGLYTNWNESATSQMSLPEARTV